MDFNANTQNCILHYDNLIEENNDPVHDPEPLKVYMNKWDGQDFIDKMDLNKSKSVLEIGVGTGRLAIRIVSNVKNFTGIDISSKTIEKAKENLYSFANVTLICNDFLSENFNISFDVIYSSLTFMHIKEKQEAINKVSRLLTDNGFFALSIDKNQSEFIDMGTYKVKIYPDNPRNIFECIKNANLCLVEQYETEFAHIFIAKKS